MVRSFILAGLMAATAVGGVAPAHAQWRVDNRAGRPDQGQGDPGARQEGRRQWQDNRQAPPQPQPPRAAQPRNDGDVRQGGGGRVLSQDRGAGQWQQRADRPGEQDRRQPPVAAANDDRYRRDNGVERRQDWREGRGDRQDWRRDPRADNRGAADGRRWNDGRDDGARGTAWRKDGRRFDDRTRWADQRRWDSGWRQDRRYDWSSYRARYGDRFRAGRYYAPRGWSYGYRPVATGFFLSSLLYSNDYWLDDPYSYRLPPAYGAMRWVRYYDDALLVDTRDGYVVDVIRDFFW